MVCNIYVYDSDKGNAATGIKPGLDPPEFPDSWRCPVCGATKDKQVQISDEEYQKKINGYEEFRGTKPREKKPSILIGTDNPDVAQQMAQEYGKPLGLRGIGQGLSYLNNLKALAKLKLKTRLITKHSEPVFETIFFGKKISMPVLGAPMSGLSFVSSISEEEFAFNILEGCRLAGTLGCTGMTAKDQDAGIAALKRVGQGINIFKPQRQEVLLDFIKQSEKSGAAAVGIDIDGAGSVNFSLAEKPVFRKTVDELRELKKSTKLPFIVKGIMSSDDALAALEAGADVIGVSNHGGRVLDSTPGTADILPEIVKVVRKTKKGKKIVITADGGVRTGYDVVKFLALGADFVLVGRPLAREALGGAEGVKNFFEYLKTDIRTAMIMTSCHTLSDINERILVKD